MDDLSLFCCVNISCPNHGKRGAGNLTVTARYGEGNCRRMLRCRTCKTRFSERHGTVFFNARLPDEKIVSILEHITEGCGVRSTHRLTGACQNSVIRYSRAAGQHARTLHEELVAISPSHP